MPIVYQVSGKNSGKDVSLIITDSLGNTVAGAQLGVLTHFSVSAEYSKQDTKSIINGGQVFFETLPIGLKCTMKFARTNSALEDMENLYRTNSYNGVQLSYTVTYITQNRDGSINTRQLVYGKPSNFNLGEYVPDQDVIQSIEFDFPGIYNQGVSTALFNA